TIADREVSQRMVSPGLEGKRTLETQTLRVNARRRGPRSGRRLAADRDGLAGLVGALQLAAGGGALARRREGEARGDLGLDEAQAEAGGRRGGAAGAVRAEEDLQRGRAVGARLRAAGARGAGAAVGAGVE